MTLIELLVVIIILTTLVAAAIPVMTPTNDDRRLREASRGVNAFISGAQARAIQHQRPYGVALKKLSQDTGRSGADGNPDNDNGVCLEMLYVEQPSPFTGFSETSMARLAFYTPADGDLYGGQQKLVRIQFVTRGTAKEVDDDLLPVGWDPDLFPSGVVRHGDVIEINGTRYQLLSDLGDDLIEPIFTDDSNTYFGEDTGKADADWPTQIVATPLNDTGQMFGPVYDNDGFRLTDAGITSPRPLPYWTEPAPYRILRQPMPTSAEPYQLPEGTAIDLRASGLALEFPPTIDVETMISGFFHKPELRANPRVDNSDPVYIMFSPEGSVASVRVNSGNPDDGDNFFAGPITANLFLLVGNRENIPVDETTNIADDPTLNIDVLTDSDLTQQRLAELREQVNWLKSTSRWIVIGAQSGRVVTVENAFVDLRNWANNLTEYRNASPLVRRAMQIQGAREFAREMRQLGGR